MQNRYFENPQGIPENTVPPPEMVGMITTIAVKVNPEREDSETRTVGVPPLLLTAVSRVLCSLSKSMTSLFSRGGNEIT